MLGDPLGVLLFCASACAVGVAALAGLLRSRGAKLAAGALLLAGVVAGWPPGGVDLPETKKLNLLLAFAAWGLVLLRALGVAAPRAFRRALVALVSLAAAVYYNFGAFHGQRTFVHYHDLTGYYLGGRYFQELRYKGLLAGMLWAEFESTGQLSVREARDLVTREPSTAADVLRKGRAVREAFTPERWREWVKDSELFRKALGANYAEVMVDHGLNGSPVWLVIGGSLAKVVPPGSVTGIRLLCLIDPLLLVAIFLAMRWAFGTDAALLAALHFFVMHDATFAWIGGAFLRYLWFAALAIGICCLKKGRFVLAGALLALASGLVIFPFFFLAGAALRAGLALLRERRLPRDETRLLGAAAVTGAALFLSVALLPGGLSTWKDFRANTAAHMDTLAPNLVGLTPVISYQPGPEWVGFEELRARGERRVGIYHLQLLLLVPALAWAASRARRGDAVQAALLALPLVFLALNLANYYWVMLLLVTLTSAASAPRLLVLFGLEIASYAVTLFTGKLATAFLFRDLFLLAALAALFLALPRRAGHPATGCTS